jgi:hypothetical protein
LQWRIVWSDLQEDQIIFASEVSRHLRKRFPIDAFVIDAETAPGWFVLEDLEQERRDSRARFARTCVAGYQPTPTEIGARPFESCEADNHSVSSPSREVQDQDRQSDQPKSRRGRCENG